MGDSKKDALEFLEKERVKIWDRILKLESDFVKGPAKFASEAQGSSNKISEFRNKAQATLDQINGFLSEVQKVENQAKGTADNINQVWTSLADTKKDIEEFSTMIEEFHENHSTLEEQVETLTTTFSKLATYQEQLNGLSTTTSSISSNLTRSNTLYQAIVAKKTEIDEFYDEFLGWEEEDETTKEKKQIPGVKDEIESKIENQKDLLDKLESRTDSKLLWVNDETQKIIQANEKQVKKLQIEIKETFNGIEKEILDLLPRALTAGLSHAYSLKKEAEEDVLAKYESRFQNGVYGLIAVSLLPFIVSILDIANGHKYSEVLLKMPSLVLAILPLYIPVLWIAYSNNRKANLAKRLIEEYTHKEVLSKTYEGLSSQISNIEDSDSQEELRVKLLFNLLEVNSENPGKLISDYNKSDHPVMDALDKSIKLTNAVTRLARIPGFNRLAKVLEKRADETLRREDEKANEGFDVIDKAKNDE